MGVMLSLPFRVDASGSIATTRDATEQLANRVFSVLATQTGDRVMRPSYGWNLNRFLFEPIDSLDEAMMLQLCKTAINTWEPGASLVGMTFGKTDEAQMEVNLFWKPAGASSVISSRLSFGTADSGGIVTQLIADNQSNTGS